MEEGPQECHDKMVSSVAEVPQGEQSFFVSLKGQSHKYLYKL